MRSDPFVEHLLELLEGVEGVRAKRMFGGHGLFHGDVMFALVADGQLYLKCDAGNVVEFEEQGLKPFTYERNGKTYPMSYREAPPECVESPAVMRRWARRAMDAATRVAVGKGGKK